MHRVGYDESRDVLVICGEGVYPARSLTVTMDGDGMVRIVSLAARTELYAHWTDVGTLEGETFPDIAGALTYLQSEFEKRRPDPAQGVLLLLAAEPIGGHKAVRIVAGGRARLASSSDVTQAGSVLGVSLTAADEGGSLNVRIIGEIEEPSWSWAPGPVFLGLAGSLVQTPPSSGFIQQIGTAKSATILVVSLSTPIVLAQ